jgi:IstB-like ATP binding protein/Transposase, Mutator family
MILTSNRGFAEWGEIFCDPVVATALLDRLLHHAIVFQIVGSSYRLRQHADLCPKHIRTKAPLQPSPIPPTLRHRGRPRIRPARMNKAADLVDQSMYETLTYYAFRDIHWHKIRTNNPLERIMKEIRRRTRVVGAFPDGQSCLNLAAPRLRHIAGTAWSARCYMNMRPLYQPQIMPTEAVA